MKCDVSKCHAACCGLVPIPAEIFGRNKGAIQGPFDLIPCFGETVIVSKHGTHRCAFLTDDCRCAIYDDRPEICRMFGESDHPLLKCEFRCNLSPTDKRYIQHTIQKFMEKNQ